MDKRLIGKLGEKLVCKWYTNNRYKILDVNYRTRMGEIDIIARKGNVIVFVEVKTRQNANFAPARDAVNYHKQHRIRAAAGQYLDEKGLGNMFARFDVAEVYHPENNPEINIIENAFE